MITEINGTALQPVHKATCHCGAVELALSLPDGISKIYRCNCSMCRRKGALMATVDETELEVTKGLDVLRMYQFNTRTAEHFFCPFCGIYTHHRKRSNPQQFGFNIGCLEGVDPNGIEKVTLIDGVNHRCDR